MKIDSKVRRIQQKYRKKIEQEKDKKKLTIEAIIVVFFIVLLFPVVGMVGNDSVNTAETSELKWMSVASIIDKTLKMTNDQYTGIAIDFNPEPIRYFLKTSIQESNLYTDDSLNEMINLANEIIKSNNLLSLLKDNETYEIIVEGKNKQELIRKAFHNSEGM